MNMNIIWIYSAISAHHRVLCTTLARRFLREQHYCR